MLVLVYWLLVERIDDCEVLQYSRDKALWANILVRLHTGKAKRSNPFNRIAGVGDTACTECKPVLDVVSVFEKIAYGLDRDFCHVLGGAVELTIRIVYLLVLQLSLNLLARAY